MDPSVLLGFPLLLALFPSCSACHCKRLHPQTYYCMSDVVLLADILGPGENTTLKRGFKVRNIQILKGNTTLSEIKNVYTPRRPKDCGYETSSKQTQVVIAGYVRAWSRVVFTKCHMLASWQQLTEEQRTGFKGEYGKGCKCEPQPCLHCSLGCPEADLTECVWKQTNCNYHSWTGKKSLKSMCVPSLSGACVWAEI